MARWLTLIVALAMVVLGVIFSALNANAVPLNLYFFQLELPAGVLVLTALFMGCGLGGLFLYFGVIVPLRMRVRAQQRELVQRQKAASTTTAATVPA
jgi:uncharacterized integral membrane protein